MMLTGRQDRMIEHLDRLLLWDYVNSWVYASKTQTIDDLNYDITQRIEHSFYLIITLLLVVSLIVYFMLRSN